MSESTELLEWREHDSASKITYTEFGPYMVERLADDRFRAWLPDESQNARLMVEGLASEKEARAFCQQDLDGRRERKFVAEVEAAFSDDEEEAKGYLRRTRSTIPVAHVVNDNQPDATAIIHVLADPPTLPVGTLLYSAPYASDVGAELLKALRDIVEAFESYDNVDPHLAAARAVIAKAEGKA